MSLTNCRTSMRHGLMEWVMGGNEVSHGQVKFTQFQQKYTPTKVKFTHAWQKPTQANKS